MCACINIGAHLGLLYILNSRLRLWDIDTQIPFSGQSMQCFCFQDMSLIVNLASHVVRKPGPYAAHCKGVLFPQNGPTRRERNHS